MSTQFLSIATPANPNDASTTSDSADFDVVSAYQRLLDTDPDLTMPVAAIEALVEALAHSSASTISETLDLLQQHTDTLKTAIANPISLSAGTDLFQRYLITTLNRPAGVGMGSSGSLMGPNMDFEIVRQHLLKNGQSFVVRAKEARDRIATYGKHFIRDGCTVLTNGGSRVVGALLKSAAEAGGLRFRVIYVQSQHSKARDASAAKSQRGRDGEGSGEGTSIVSMLRSRGVPVATIPDAAVAYSLGRVDMVIVGAEGVVENGGIISRMGTYQMGLLAKAKGKPFYVVAESHKFVRLYPLSQYDLPIEQNAIEFRVGEKEEVVDKVDGHKPSTVIEDEGVDVGDGKTKSQDPRAKCTGSTAEDAVDFTPPDLISGIITESGVLTPSAVSEELIKIWF